MNSDYDGPVNLGNPQEYTIKDFAEYIQQLTKTSSKILNLPKSHKIRQSHHFNRKKTFGLNQTHNQNFSWEAENLFKVEVVQLIR